MKNEKEFIELINKQGSVVTYLENTETGKALKDDEDALYVFTSTPSVLSFLMKIDDVKNYKIKNLEGGTDEIMAILKTLTYTVKLEKDVYDIEDKIMEPEIKSTPFEDTEPKESEFDFEAILKSNFNKKNSEDALVVDEPLTPVEEIKESLNGVNDNATIWLVSDGEMPIAYFSAYKDVERFVSSKSFSSNLKEVLNITQEDTLFDAYYASNFDDGEENSVLANPHVPFNNIKATSKEIAQAIQEHFSETCVSEHEIEERITKGQNFWYNTILKSVVRMQGTEDFALFDDERKMNSFGDGRFYLNEKEYQKAHVAEEKALVFYQKALEDTRFVFFNAEQHCKSSDFIKVLQKVQKM